MADVTTRLQGLIRGDLKFEPPLLVNVTGQGDAPAPWETSPPVTIRDARPLQDAEPSPARFFDDHGFVLLPHRTEVEDWSSGPGDGASDIARLYLPEVERLIRQVLLPGRRLEIQQFASLIRRGPGSGNGYAESVHQDHGLRPDDYQQNVEAFSTAEYAASWRARFEQPDVAGFMVLDFWRTILMTEPLRHKPLAVCDPTSVRDDDIVPIALDGISPSGKTSSTLGLRYDPGQTWYYFPDMTADEVLVFKLFDYSKDKPGRGLRSCFHTAFTDPGAPAGAAPRQSCEHRVGVLVLRD